MTSKLPEEPAGVMDPKAVAGATAAKNFVNPGILLFIDQLIIAVGGWAFWIMVPRFTTSSEIGQATSIYSLVLLFSTIAQLGLEYPLLKRSLTNGSKLFGTVIVIELMITAGSIVPVILVIDVGYNGETNFAWLAVGILIFSSVSFVTRFAMLGTSNTRALLIIDVAGTLMKFIVGILLVSKGYGAYGIMLALLFQALVVMIGSFLVTSRRFGLKWGELGYYREIVKDALVNSPSKLSAMLVVSLSVVLLTSYGIDSANVGIFYLAVMVSIVAGTFASSLAFMSIPASSAAQIDLSLSSLRLGLASIAPITAVILIVPSLILSLVGEEYVIGSDILVILGIAIIPSVTVANAVTKFNNLGKSTKLLTLGLLRIVSFAVAFVILVPKFEVLGASYAIVTSVLAPAIVSIFWFERALLKYLMITLLSVGTGVLVGYLARIATNSGEVLTAAVAITASLLVIFTLKLVSLKEISMYVRLMRTKEHD
jgi:O-antigen/teichoic acid export membrane protein